MNELPSFIKLPVIHLLLIGITVIGFTSGCSESPKIKGEAFLVMQSDEVKPLADRKIVFLPEGFKQRFLSAKQQYVMKKKQSLSEVLKSNTDANNTIAAFDKQIAQISQQITFKRDQDPVNKENVAGQVDSEIKAEQAAIKNQTDSLVTRLSQAEKGLTSLANSAQAKFESEGRLQLQTIENVKSTIDELSTLLKDFDTAAASANRQLDAALEAQKKANTRIQPIPGQVAKLLNESIRNQKLQTPLIDEETFQIAIENNNTTYGNRPSNYIRTTDNLKNLGEEYQDVFEVPVDLLQADNMPKAMTLVREYESLTAQEYPLRRRVRTAEEHREKVVTPWINLNSVRISDIRSELGVEFRINSGTSWPPSAYILAKEALTTAKSHHSSLKISFDDRSLDKFKSQLTSDAQQEIDAITAQLSQLQQKSQSLPGSADKRIADISQKIRQENSIEVEQLESELETLDLEKASFLHEIDNESQETLLRAFTLEFLSIVRSSTVSSIQTDRSGDFVVPEKTKYVWCHIRRDSGDDLFWLINAKADAANKILLSNSTLTATSNLDWITEFAFD
jgi:hypothetical protein